MRRPTYPATNFIQQSVLAEHIGREMLRRMLDSPCPAKEDKASHDWEHIALGYRCRACEAVVER